MAYTSKFGYTNVTPSTDTVAPIKIGPCTNYAKIEDEVDACVLSNKTTSLDQGELISYKATKLDKISTSQLIQHPSPVRNGIQYVIKAEEILRTTDATGTIIMDEPVVAYLTIRHQSSSNITNALVAEAVTRVLGACRREDGTWRFDDLMRNALDPSVN